MTRSQNFLLAYEVAAGRQLVTAPVFAEEVTWRAPNWAGLIGNFQTA
jgi:hypothetical protein